MFHPCGHRIIVRRDAVEDKTATGIILTASEDAKKLEAANCQTGVVVAIGPDAWKAFRMLDENGKERNGKSWADVGDHVLFSKYSGRNVNEPYTPDEQNLVFLNDEDVLAVITKEPQPLPEEVTKIKETE